MSKISVVIPTYNCAKFLPQAIESVLNQTCQDFELIVVDDGSTDNTKDIVSNYAKTNKNTIKYIFQNNSGPSAARNTGLKVAQAEYITLLDSDDYWDITFFEKGLKVLEDDKCDIVVCDNYRIELRDGKVVSKEIMRRSDLLEQNANLYVEFLKKDLIGGPSRTISKKKIFNEIGGYDESLWLHQEWDFWIRFFKIPRKIGLLREPLYYYHVRNDGSNITRRFSSSKGIIEIYRIYQKFKGPILKNAQTRSAFATHFADCSRQLFIRRENFLLFIRCLWEAFRLKFF